MKLPKICLDLGCGNRKKVGYIGIDKYPGKGIDHVLDLEKSLLPFQDSSVGRVYASHFLEHVDNLFWIMEEVWRVLKPDGVFVIVVPYYRSRIAFQDPTHRRFFTEVTFKKYFGSNYLNPYYENQRKCNFAQTFLQLVGQNFDNLCMTVYLKAIK